MSYHPLANDTGGTLEDRRNEADRILTILSEHASPEAMSEREARFVAEQMGRSNDHASWSVSPKQLFWLRDIKSKYAE